jgi:hypothetical protein
MLLSLSAAPSLRQKEQAVIATLEILARVNGAALALCPAPLV